ncbi:MAG: OmpA family protein [Myxococcales bacterium]|nr:OmpA family protein [Myxococcales bacterium]
MSLQRSAIEQEGPIERDLRDDSTCRVQQVIPTGTILVAALERLNRKSSIALFQALVQKLDDHERRLVAAAEALASQERRARRVCLLCLLLALLLGGLCFLLGLYTMRRVPPVHCVAACSSASVAGVSAAAKVPATASATTTVPPPHPESARAAVAGSQIKEPQQTAALAISGHKLQSGTMESELLSFLRRPGPRTSHIFTMDRLKYPPHSHEVNEEGKEQIFLLAKILLAYPSVRIEIRGHKDGTESELYTGPDPLPGYSLSQLRANCVLRRLQGMNVPAERMRIRGLGSTQAVAENRSAEERQHNRRVEIVVLP